MKNSIFVPGPTWSSGSGRRRGEAGPPWRTCGTLSAPPAGRPVYGKAVMRAISNSVIFAIRLYQAAFPLLRQGLGIRGHCRFSPSCSEYAVLSIRKHGAATGIWLGIRRLARCHPFASSVPEEEVETPWKRT